MSWDAIRRDQVVRALENHDLRVTEDGRVRVCKVRKPITWNEDAVATSWTEQPDPGSSWSES